MKFIMIIKNVEEYNVKNESLSYSNIKGELFLNDKLIDDNYQFSGMFFENYLYYHPKNNTTNFVDLKTNKKKVTNCIFYKKNEFEGDFLTSKKNFKNANNEWESDLFLYSTSNFSEIKQLPNVIGGFYRHKNFLIQIKNKKTISLKTIDLPELLWQFNLESLGKFEDRDGNLQNYEVLKFIGAWQNSILVACSGQLVLDINSKTGELNRKWQALPGYGSSAFQGRLQHKLPSTDGFQLDISKSYLYHLAGAFLVTIDLVTGKADYQSLKNTLEENVFSGFRWSTGYAEDETHIYTIAEMNRFELGLDYIPQCIVAFNKKTLKIDWHYRFEGDWVKTDIPQLANNKLYQLSGDNTLYIFEKEE